MPGVPDYRRSAAPAFGTDRGRWYMPCEAGQRGSTRVAVDGAI